MDNSKSPTYETVNAISSLYISSSSSSSNSNSNSKDESNNNNQNNDNNNSSSSSHSLLFNNNNIDLFMKYVHQQIKEDELSADQKNTICKVMDLVNYSNTQYIY